MQLAENRKERWQRTERRQQAVTEYVPRKETSMEVGLLLTGENMRRADMEINEVYAFFGRPRLHDNKIKRIEVTLDELRSCLLPGGIRYDKDRVDSSPKNQMEEVMARIDELERELEEEQKRKQCAVLEIDRSLMKVPEGPYKTLLAEYYIGRISINKIADGMGVSVRHCFRMRKKAVETFCEIMNKDSRTSQDASAEVTISK